MAPDGPAGLYLHVPFCLSKCRYCGFYSTTEVAHEPVWVEAVGREVDRVRGEWRRFDTLYVGGGTPSALASTSLHAVLGRLERAFDVDAHAERTLEVNPGDVTADRARAWRSLGFSRASVGVQSLRDEELRWLGRRHDREQALRAIQDLRTAGFLAIGVDLVQGLPGQTLAARLESIERALELAPEHVSAYELTVDPGTPLAVGVHAGRMNMPEPEVAAEGYLASARLLRSAGYFHYEVSNFAREPRHVSRHNQKYWTGARYLGLGPAAHSFNGRKRWANLRSLERYIQARQGQPSCLDFEEELSPEALRWERVALGLRCAHGVSPDDLTLPEAETVIQALERAGKLERRGQRLVPTLEGYLVADALSRQLLLGSAAEAR